MRQRGHRSSRSPSEWRLALLTLCLLGMSCRESTPTNTLQNPIVAADAQGSSDLQQGLDFLERVEEFNLNQVHQKVLYHLQQWLSRQTVDAAWTPDPWSQRIPAEYQPLMSPARLGELKLDAYDIQVFQETLWLRDIARAVLTLDTLPSDLRQRLGDNPAPELLQAAQLFDWTVRNLQLDADVAPGDRHRFNSDIQLYPWECLLFGRGTMAEKSLVFVMLARQCGLPVVMLGIRQEDATQITDWLPALALEGQLYLFEMRLGIPVPAEGGKRIATLQDVVNAPQLLEPLGIFPDFPYPVTVDLLPRVVAQMDLSPTTVARRMVLLEGVLAGEKKATLTSPLSGLADTLQASPGLADVAIWEQSFRAIMSRRALANDQTAFLSLALEHSLFDQQRQMPLFKARILYFRGQFENSTDRPGARSVYLETRVADDEIRQITQHAATLTAHPDGTPVTPEEIERAKMTAANINYVLRRSKQNASYWLGTMAFDRGQYEVATDYLKKRVLDADAESPWRDGATYNLGRAYEAWGRMDNDPDRLRQAVEIYRTLTDGPSAPACQWRARALKAELEP